MPFSQRARMSRCKFVLLEPLLVPLVVTHDPVEHRRVERVGIAAAVSEALLDVRFAGLVDALGGLRAGGCLDEAVDAKVGRCVVPRPL